MYIYCCKRHVIQPGSILLKYIYLLLNFLLFITCIVFYSIQSHTEAITVTFALAEPIVELIDCSVTGSGSNPPRGTILIIPYCIFRLRK